jgi:metallo-beta-lactamase family protein
MMTPTDARRPVLTFLGGVGTVTGSKHLVESARSSVLVDCGLFQGLSSVRRRNWAAPPIDLHRLDAVVLTHAHLDHSGYLPALARHGWAGPVYVTEGTARLARIVLADSAHLQEDDARFANDRGWSKHHPALPLYDARDADRACSLFEVVDHGRGVPITDDITLTLGRAGSHPRFVVGASGHRQRLRRPVFAVQRRPRPVRASTAAAAASPSHERRARHRVDLR